MRIEKLDIRGFRRLRGKFEFDPHLTIVCGENEAGKSTLREAVVRSLFGFSGRERRRLGGRPSVLETRRPWNGNPYAVHAIVQTSDGRLRIEWDFDDYGAVVRNLDTGQDLTAEIPHGGGGAIHLGQYLLGLELDDFLHTSCIEQGAISAVPDNESLKDAMQRAVEEGASESGVEEAKELLYAVLREDIGVRRDTLNPLSSGPLPERLARRDELADQLEHAEAERERIAELEREAVAAEAERERVEAEMRAVEQSMLAARAEELTNRLESARRHAESAQRGAEQASDRDVSDEQQAKIVGRFQELERIDRDLAALGPQAERAEEDLARLEHERADLQARLDELGADKVDDSAVGNVRDLLARREAAAEEAAQAEAQSAAESERKPSAPAGPLWAAAAVIAVASIGLGALVSPLAFAGLLFAAVVAYLAYARVQESSRLAAELRLAEERLQQARGRLEELDRELNVLLDRAGARPGASSEQRARAYLAAAERHAQALELRLKIGEINNRINAARKPLSDRESAEQRRRDVRAELADALDELGIDAQDLVEARREFDARVAETRRRAEQRAAAEEAARALETALAGKSMEELEREQQEALERLAAHVERHGELDQDLSAEELESRERELRGKREELVRRITTLRTRIREAEEGLPDVPTLREKLERLEEEIARLEEAADAIKLATGVLDEAAREAHRAFRPRLKGALERNLARITRGRYREAEVDEKLNVQVVAPETGSLVPAEQLSRGTQDQIYFIERLEILDMLDTTTGGAPLLLDEPFAHFDQKRLGEGLRLLADETHERQVLLFTCNDDLVEAAHAACENAAVIRLPGPV